MVILGVFLVPFTLCPLTFPCVGSCRAAAAWWNLVSLAARLGKSDGDGLFRIRHLPPAAGTKASTLELVHLFSHALLRLASITTPGAAAGAAACVGLATAAFTGRAAP